MPQDPLLKLHAVPDDEYDHVHARSVMTDAQKLAFDGYVVETELNDDIIMCFAQFKIGQKVEDQRQLVTLEHTPQNLTEMTRRVSVVAAMLDYLNVGGDPVWLGHIAADIGDLPTVVPDAFEVVAAHTYVERTVFYKDTAGQYFEVLVGCDATPCTAEKVWAALNERDEDDEL